MSESMRRLTVLGLAGLLLAAVAGESQARQARRFGGINVNSNPTIRPAYTVSGQGFSIHVPSLTLGQYAYNTAVLGRAYSFVPPYALGYNPYRSGRSSTPSLLSYALSTNLGGYNPYLGGASPYAGGAGLLSTSPYGGYSLSTTGDGASPYGYYPPASYIPPNAANLVGLASLTSAQGQYWKQIEEARITREKSRQMSLETARKEVELQRWYDNTRVTANQVHDRDLATDLARARMDAPSADVWSGKALNDLFRSIKASKALNRGPNLPLSEEITKHINLTTGPNGNIGLLKNNDGMLDWPAPLQQAPFDELRKSLDRNLRRAVADLKGKDPVDRAMLKDITREFKDLSEKLNENADDFTPSQYIEAKHFLAQLSSAIKALTDPKAPEFFNNNWTDRVKNVAELVAYMSKEGLFFAPATPGDENAYNALYQLMRTFEASVQSLRTRD